MLIVRLYRFGAWVLPLVPYRLAYAICGLAAWLIFWLLPSKRRAVLSNLSHVFPDYPASKKAKIARGIFKNNLCNYVDIMRVGSMTGEQVSQQVQVNGIQYVREAEKRGKGVIAVAAHLGSFSYILRLATLVDMDFYLLVEPINPPELYDFIKNQRQSDPRARVIPIGGPEVREVFRALKRNHIVCFAIDRDVTGDGVMLDFFGAPAPIPTGVAEIALRTGAEIVFVHPYRLPNGKQIVDFYPGFTPESTGDKDKDARQLTERMLRELEKMIRRTPENWVVLYPIWGNCP